MGMRPSSTVVKAQISGGIRTMKLDGACIARWILLTVCAAVTAACAQLGPRALSAGRPLYNMAVQETESQQLLLNIVRQRYSDPVMFIGVTSITSGFNVSANANLAHGTDKTVGTLGASISESPIISYAPNVGEKFVRQMLRPLDIRTVGLVLQAGWSIERLFLMVGQQFSSYQNIPGGSDGHPDLHRLQKVLSALRDLQRDGSLIVGVEPGKEADKDELLLTFTQRGAQSDAYQVICKGVNIACDGRPVRLKQAVGSIREGDTLPLSTRSLFSTLYFLSQGVAVPAEHEADGIATPVANVAGGAFNWTKSRGGLFQVRSSADEPKQASVKVFYRGSWFYIADNDANSKVTFALLSMLMTLQSGETARVTPLITVPAL